MVIHQSDKLTTRLDNLFPKHSFTAQALRQTPHRAAIRSVIGYTVKVELKQPNGDLS